MSPDEAVKVLVDLGNLRGGPDNITAVIVKVGHPKLATSGNGASGKSTRGSSSDKPLVPATFWGVFIGSIIVSILLYFFAYWQIALFTGLISVAAVGYLISRLIKSSFQGKHSSSGQVFGKGPYVRLGCASSGQFAKQLADMLRKLQEGALRENWKVDWPKLKSFTNKAEQATSQEDHSTAIANYGRAVSFLMDQLRNQEDASSSSIEL